MEVFVQIFNLSCAYSPLGAFFAIFNMREVNCVDA